MAKIGYARVSSVGQKLDAQIKKLKDFGCTKIFEEKISGLDQNRPQLKRCLEYLREDDLLVVTKLDRLARSATHLGRIVERFKKEGINFKVLDQDIDTSTPSGKLMFHIVSAFAEFEHSIRHERQMDGVKSALARGTRFGRPRKTTPEIIEKIVADKGQGMTIPQIQKKYNISSPTIFRVLRAYREQGRAN